jgi:hypothetical protein
MHDASDGPPAVNPALCAGVALFNEGYHLAAHEPWEAAWLPLETGDDERLLHGLIAATAATHHATDRNWSGAAGCAANAVDYLTAVSPGHRDVSLEPVVEWCRRLRVDPETIERVGPPRIRVDEAATGFTDLDVHAALLAAPGLASTVERRLRRSRSRSEAPVAHRSSTSSSRISHTPNDAHRSPPGSTTTSGGRTESVETSTASSSEPPSGRRRAPHGSSTGGSVSGAEWSVPSTGSPAKVYSAELSRGS